MFEAEIHCKPGCKYCDLAEEYLNGIGIPYKKVMYDPSESDYEEKRDSMFAAHGHRSFPNIYVNSAFVGGFDEMKSLFESESDEDDF